jgi:hypothetical protein
MNGVRRFLTMQAQLQRECRTLNGQARPAGWHYDSEEDFVLQHGQESLWAPLPAGVRYGRTKECFKNAMRLADRRPDLMYVEGWASRPALGIPMHHGWCVDAQGQVVDPTWRVETPDEPPIEYLGVAFTMDQVHAAQVRSGVYGILYMDFDHLTWPLDMLARPAILAS